MTHDRVVSPPVLIRILARAAGKHLQQWEDIRLDPRKKQSTCNPSSPSDHLSSHLDYKSRNADKLIGIRLASLSTKGYEKIVAYTCCPPLLTVRTLKYQCFPSIVIRQIVPLKTGVVQNLQVFSNEVVKDHVAGYGIILEVHGTRIAKTEGPVI